MDTYPGLDENIISFEKLLEFPSVLSSQRFSRHWKKALLVSADFCSMFLSVWLVYSIFEIFGLKWGGSLFFFLLPLSLVFWGAFTLVGLYRSRGVNPVEELRLLISTTTVIYLSIFAFNLLMGETRFPILMIILAWFITIGLMPLIRIAARRFGLRIGMWGEPVVVLGSGELSQRIISFLLRNSFYGLRPMMVVDDMTTSYGVPITTDFVIPAISFERLFKSYESGSKLKIRTAIVVASEIPASICDSMNLGEHLGFKNIIIVSKQFNIRNVGLMPLDFGGVLGLEERHYELEKIETWQIRIMDLLLILAALPILIPVFLLIMAVIKLDSRGSIFYRQARVGKGARALKVIKFRTMVQNADKVLAKCLEENPILLADWQANHKLKNDPRITRIGRILRKTSLDELPQLWNVVKGEMSIVGPRPIVTDEIKRYGDQFIYYTQVPPGITGLWQVSGRNDVKYDQRVYLDKYYVCNRSIWLNLHIIMRTASAVLRRRGAY